jgi:hypothetical protein
MPVEVLKGGWVKQGSVIAFPHEWQRPAKTEEWVFEALISNKSYSPIVNFICFPWATLIDLIDRKQEDKAEGLINALGYIPDIKARIAATACQHINIKNAIPLMKEIGVTDLYWSHKSLKVNCIDGIRIHPLPLYPVAYYKFGRGVNIPLSDRRYKVTFVGAYDKECYLSNIRDKIFLHSNTDKNLIIKRDKWHFDSLVYGKQILNLTLSPDEINQIEDDSAYYSDILSNSVYSLCPSGSGVNSIRLWESICFGCISVILSDDFDSSLIKSNYKCIKIKESDLDDFMSNVGLNLMSFQNEEEPVSAESFLSHIVKDLFDPFFLRKISTSNEYHQ